MQPATEARDGAQAIEIQQAIWQQAQDVAYTPISSDSPTSGHPVVSQHNTDLLTSDDIEDVLPPPAYGNGFGEIHNEKNGLGTTAVVADDGRVDIRINQISRHLSQIFTPALRQQMQLTQDSGPPPPPYIPPSLVQTDQEARPPPSLNVVIHVVGSRGDVQPFIALGQVLRSTYGHRVRLATHPQFQNFVQESGLEFFNIGGDPSRLMAFMAQNPSLVGFRSIMTGDIGKRRRDVGEYIQGCWRSCYEAGDGTPLLDTTEEDDDQHRPEARPFVADCIIANPPSFAHVHCAEKMGVPLHIMFTMPYSPTQAFPHPLANIKSSNADAQLTNFLSYTMIELLSWQGLGDIINRFRKKCLGLDPVSSLWAPGMLHRLKVPHTYCWSPALISKPQDWGSHLTVSGFCFLNSPDYQPDSDLLAFLESGPPPIYIGFGSIVLKDPDSLTSLIFDAVRQTNQRVLLSKGWGGLGAEEIPEGVFLLGNVPHDWLFQRVSCIVHHGGAGTTAAGIAAGRPTVVIPFFGDQPFWGAMLARAGAGPEPIPYKQLTAQKLADAIRFCLAPECLERAQSLAQKISAERGNESAAQSIQHHLDLDRYRCDLVPSLAAVWRIKGTKIKLSPLAACTLANAKFLEFRNLRLLRIQEYNTDEGPLDPISGGATAVLRSFYSMGMGIVDIPTETWKAIQLGTTAGSRASSSSTVPTIMQISDAPSAAANRPTLSSSKQSENSLKLSRSNLARLGRSSSNVSDAEKYAERSSRPTTPHSYSSPPTSVVDTASSQSQSRGHEKLGSSQQQDMLRRTGPHTSKGIGRFTRALVQSPVDLSVNLTKGLHNMPKLWGDDTVRPQEQVNDFQSGMKAVGREFGYGWYDGLTGLVTQPWKGAQQGGASGFAKGVGKGIGGFIVKPGAAFLGVLGHTMKGVHKEVQKAFGSNVQSYIIASRAAQGYDAWLQSSDDQKQDIISHWKRLQKDPQRKWEDDDAVSMSETQARDRRHQESGQPLTSTQLFPPVNITTQTNESEVADSERSTGEAIDIDHDTSSTTQRPSSSDNALTVLPDPRFEDNPTDGYFRQSPRERRPTTNLTRKPLPVRDPVVTSPSTLRDAGHLAGMTHDAHKVQQQQGEKTTQERTEERIVLEYVKKQSLLEAQHRSTYASSRPNEEADEEENLRKALELSLQESGRS